MMINGYINLFVICIALTIILFLPIYFILKKKGKGITRQFSYLLWLFSLILIVFTTIILFNLPFRFNQELYILNLRPFQWLENEHIKSRIVSEIAPNIILFIPLGIFTPIAFKRLRKWYMSALVIFMITFSIEFFQYFIGRSSDVDDLIANLLGGMIGYGLYKICDLVFKNKTLWKKFNGDTL